MIRTVLTAIGFLFFCVAGISCDSSNDDPISSSDDDDDNDDNNDDENDDDDSDDDSDDDDDNNDDNDDNNDDTDDTDTEEEICAETDIEIEIIPVNMMILQDVSGSMILDENDNPATEPTKWTQAKNAISAMLNNFQDKINFGADRFPSNQQCGTTNAALTDTLPSNGSNIVSLLGAISPAGATPLYLAMQEYTNANHAPLFTGGDSDSYLVVISDGADTCGLSGNAMMDEATPQQLTQVTTTLLNNNIKTFVIGFGTGADPTQLNAIAAAGGTSMTEYIDAVNEQELTDNLNEIASSIISCVYELNLTEDENDVNMDEVDVLFDGVPVGYDEDCAQGIGWTWLDDDKTQFEFCEEACASLEAGEVDQVSITVGCPPEPVPQ